METAAFFLAAGLAQALGTAAGIIQAIGLVSVFGGQIGARFPRCRNGIWLASKTSLVIAAIGGLAWLIAQAFFAAGGAAANISPRAIKQSVDRRDARQ